MGICILWRLTGGNGFGAIAPGPGLPGIRCLEESAVRTIVFLGYRAIGLLNTDRNELVQHVAACAFRLGFVDHLARTETEYPPIGQEDIQPLSVRIDECPL